MIAAITAIFAANRSAAPLSPPIMLIIWVTPDVTQQRLLSIVGALHGTDLSELNGAVEDQNGAEQMNSWSFVVSGQDAHTVVHELQHYPGINVQISGIPAYAVPQ